MSKLVSQSVEDYLKVIFKLAGDQPASTGKIAEALHVSAASVTSMVKRLSKQNLVEYISHRGVSLTEEGRQKALRIIRHHRLLETFLIQVMGYTWDEVHPEAERLEHHISERFAKKMAAMLDNPDYDPHGDPIPNAEGKIPQAFHLRLSEIEPGSTVLVRRVGNDDAKLLRYFHDIGLHPKARITVKDKAPFNGPITVVVDQEERIIGNHISQQVFVELLKK